MLEIYTLLVVHECIVEALVKRAVVIKVLSVSRQHGAVSFDFPLGVHDELLVLQVFLVVAAHHSLDFQDERHSCSCSLV